MLVADPAPYPRLRGNQWCSKALTRLLGPVPLRSADGIWLDTQLSSAMHLPFLDPDGGRHDLFRQAIAALQPGDRMLNVGANTVFLLLLAARRVGQSGLVIVVEPSQREFQRLLAKLSLYRASVLLALNLAGGDQAGISWLTIEPDRTGLNASATREKQAATAHPARCCPWLRSDWAS